MESGTTLAVAGIPVLYQTRWGWAGRAATPSGQSWYVDVPPGVSSLAEAQTWAEGSLGMMLCIPKAAGSPHPMA